MKKLLFSLMACAAIGLTSCVENKSNGERIGLITQFSTTGYFWKTWEGHLNLTQTGMNSSSAVPFDFSVDGDKMDQSIVDVIGSAAEHGWKVKLVYHEVGGLSNFFFTRGETDHFITSVEVLDKTPIQSAMGSKPDAGGRVIDTVYLVIDKKQIYSTK